MTVPDTFSAYYADLLQGTYDCLDRIVLNAFYPLGRPPVGCALGGDTCMAMTRNSTTIVCATWQGRFQRHQRRGIRWAVVLRWFRLIIPRYSHPIRTGAAS